MKPHKHSELIKAWADGAEIQWKHDGYTDWQDTIKPDWNPDANYRIKPEPKPDVVMYGSASFNGIALGTTNTQQQANLKLIFDGETGELKYAEVIK